METRLTYNCAHIRSTNESLVVLGQWKAVLVGTWLYRVDRRWHCLVLCDTGSVWGGTGWYLVELGHYGAELVDT